MRHQIDTPTSGIARCVHENRVAVRLTSLPVLCGCAALLTLAIGTPLSAQDQSTQIDDSQGAQMGDSVEPSVVANGATEAEPKALEQDPTQPVQVEGQIVEQSANTFQVTELIGSSVASLDGEKIGEIIDLLFDANDRIEGYIVGVGGFFGIGARQIALEADQVMRVETPDGIQQMVLNYTLEELERAPEFVSLDEQVQARAEEEARLEQQRLRESVDQPAAPASVPTQ